MAAILLVMALNLRGVRESGVAFAVPTYAFIVGVAIMLGWGLFRIYVLGEPLRAESAGFVMHAERSRNRRLRVGVPGGAVVLIRLRRADRCGGDQQRRPGFC